MIQMTTVTYDIVINATIEVDAEQLIEESAREIIESACDEMGQADIHDIQIEVA
tara:strand:+ start:219 stop:380 length:162 start_codon:yes stop_codon:yes gene_type:complete